MTPFETVRRDVEEILLQSAFSEEPLHAINTVEWLLQFEPDADENLRFAAYVHDVERSIPEAKVSAAAYDTYDDFMEAHAKKSAEVVAGMLRRAGADQADIDDISRLIAEHETGGGDPRIDLLKNADVMSFFHVCLPLYYDRKGPDLTRKRIVWKFRKMTEDARGEVVGIDYPDPEVRELVHDALGFGD